MSELTWAAGSSSEKVSVWMLMDYSEVYDPNVGFVMQWHRQGNLYQYRADPMLDYVIMPEGTTLEEAQAMCVAAYRMGG